MTTLVPDRKSRTPPRGDALFAEAFPVAFLRRQVALAFQIPRDVLGNYRSLSTQRAMALSEQRAVEIWNEMWAAVLPLEEQTLIITSSGRSRGRVFYRDMELTARQYIENVDGLEPPEER